MIDLINDARAARGLARLATNDQLAAAAMRHAQDISRNVWITQGDSHIGSDGSTSYQRIMATGYVSDFVREITGWGWDGDDPTMLRWWTDSPIHHDIMFDQRPTEAGEAKVQTNDGWRCYWVVTFGRGVGAPTPPEEPPVAPYTTYVPMAAAPGATSYDLLDYLRGNGQAYMVQHPGGAQEKFRTIHLPAHRFLQLKNNQWEEFWYNEEYIFRGRDTSPGDGQYYRQFEDANEGARWAPRRMAVGQSWTSPVQHTVQTYDKATCRPVDHHRNGRATNSLRLVAHHRSMTWNDITVNDVIELQTHTGESMYFGRGWGLVAWGSPWGGSAIASVLPAHEADNQPESGCVG